MPENNKHMGHTRRLLSAHKDFSYCYVAQKIRLCFDNVCVQARSVHMGQIRLLLFARNDMFAAISHIEKGWQVRD